ncbi:MAG TPA: orotidine-5'-phosphate decarboxylase [Tepidisphaeraceae bacterium]|jgi:orotidine-5'-phosphate decarboxylase|nr:orotidine-5'-phosphate decarboxylase [Tepidisphaeraceae bacterium]
MPTHFADRLLAAIAARKAPICVGIDPIVPMLPEDLLPAGGGSDNGNEAALDAIFAFVTRVLKVVAPLVPCVKFQSAYFEQFHSEGVEAYFSLVGEARELGLITIGDVKRGDIGSTAAAYAVGHLAERSLDDGNDARPPDAITVNPMLGLDTIEPFVKAAADWRKGLFVLVRTSNPGSTALQDVKLADGRTWSEMLADQLRPMTESAGMVGEQGYSAIGAVVGATQPQTMKSLRERLPRSIFLLPGYGAQGATAEMTRAAFRDGRGALVSASRSILYAGQEAKYRDRFGTDWERCIEQAVIDMKADVGRVIGG